MTAIGNTDTYLIWSTEHSAWWKQGSVGYTRSFAGAGHFSRKQALEICRNALPDASHIGHLAEIPVRHRDVATFLAGAAVPSIVLIGE